MYSLKAPMKSKEPSVVNLSKFQESFPNGWQCPVPGEYPASLENLGKTSDETETYV